jgi:hypothetical protein
VTHDPFKLCTEATCPHCGVKGRLVAEQEARGNCDYGDDDFELLTCVECGGLHESHGSSGDEHLKAMRIQYGRLIEGRPFEPPKPVERIPVDTEMKSIDMTWADKMLREYYKADAEMWNGASKRWGYSIAELTERARAMTAAWPPFPSGIALSMMPDGPEKELAANALPEPDVYLSFTTETEYVPVRATNDSVAWHRYPCCVFPCTCGEAK